MPAPGTSGRLQAPPAGTEPPERYFQNQRGMSFRSLRKRHICT